MEQSPLFIRIALHYHYSPAQWQESSPAATEVHRELVKAGMIAESAGEYMGLIEPLRLYAEALGNVPVPVRKWVMPDTDK